MDEQIIKEILSEAKKANIEKIVVGAFILNENKILLLERHSSDFMGGIYELPSGNLEPGETLFQGLKREIKEETNLDVENFIAYIDYFDYLSRSGKKVRQFNFYVSAFDKKISLSEHINYAWATPGDMAFNRTTDSVKKAIQKLYLYLSRSKNGR